MYSIGERTWWKWRNGPVKDWGGDPKEITHLYWGTMTGAMDSPTIDIALTNRLGLNLDVKRTSIEGMGCLTGYRLLNLATEAAAKNPSHRILVIEADLRSAIGNSLPKNVSRSHIVSAALFCDGASATVVGSVPQATETPCYEVLGGKSRIVPDTRHLVNYLEQEDGAIQLYLDRNLPDAIESVELDFVSSLLKQVKHLDLPPIQDFDIASHTGGPKILQKVGLGLGIDHRDHLGASWKVMKAHGNLSGASNMAVLDEQNKSGGRDWVICISMGPGVCLEGLVLRRPDAKGRLTRTPPVSRTSLGDLEVDKMIDCAIHKKHADGHISTNYLGKWGVRNWMLFGLVVAAAMVLWVEMGVTLVDETDSEAALITSSVLTTMALLATAVVVCACFRIEDATLLSFVAILTFHMGALVNLVSGMGYAGNAPSFTVFSPIGTLVGTCLLTLGMLVFSYTSIIYQDWQYMLQYPLLALAFLLRAATAVIWTNKSFVDEDSPLRSRALYVEVGAGLLFLIGSFFGLSKAYKKMQAPWLTPPNYQAYGISLYGLGEVVLNGAVIFLRISGSAMESSVVGVVDKTARAVLFCASALLLFDTARTAYRLEKTLDYSAPSTTRLCTNDLGLRAWYGTSAFLILAGLLRFVAHVGFPFSKTVQAWMDVGGHFLVAIAFAFVVVALASQRYTNKQDLPIHSGRQVTSVSLLVVGFTVQGIALPLGFFGGSVVGIAIAMLGSAILASVFLSRPHSCWSVRVWNPYTWVNLLYSNNCFLLSVFYVFLSSLLDLFGQAGLSAVAVVMGGVGFLLHTAMARYVFSMTHTERDVQKDRNNKVLMDVPLEFFEEEDARHEADVLIVGAGPTGLLLASILGRHGLKVVLVEKRPGSVTDARWTVVNSASLEHLSKVLDLDLYNELRIRAMPDSTPLGSMLVTGMADDDAKVLQQATTPSRKTLMEDLGAIPDLYESRSLGSKHAQELPIRANQSHQETVLKKQVERWSNVKVLYGHELVDLKVVNRKDADGAHFEYVLGSVEDIEKRTTAFMVRSRFVVGCDGPGSTVASKLQVHYDGFLNLAKTRSILARAPGLYEKVLNNVGGTFMYQIVKPFGFAGVVAADPKEHVWNFLMMFGKETLEASAQTICEEFLGTKDVEPLQDRFWYWNFFIARQLRLGPGFLAGDAAHSWPPFGALGGNQGYGDAANLGWKLAAVCKGWGSDRLLDSYNSERRQAAVQTALFVLNHSPRPDLIVRFLPFLKWPIVRRWFSTLWKHQNSGSHNANHFSQAGTQLGTKYSHSQTLCAELVATLQDDPFCNYVPVIHNGARLPYVEVTTPKFDREDPTSIYDLVGLAGFTLFVVQKDGESKPVKGSGSLLTDCVVDLFVETFSGMDSKVQVEYLSESNLNTIVREEQGARAEAAVEIVKETLILVRPDHVICWHWSGDHSELMLDSSGQDDTPAIFADISATVTGRDDSPQSKNVDLECASHQRWLTTQFMHNLRPFMFNFPKALPIENNFKEEAVQSVKLAIKKNAEKKAGRERSKLSTAASSTPFENEYDVTTANINRNGKSKGYVMGASTSSDHTV